AVPAGGAGDAVQPEAIPGGEPMSAQTMTGPGSAVPGAPRRGVASRITGRVGGGAVQGVLVVIAVVWLVPTLGLFGASLRSQQHNNASGWWHVFTTPSQLTVKAYADLLSKPDFVNSFWNTVLIAVPATVLVVAIAALAAYAFAWLEFPGRDWLFLLVV